MISSIAGGIGLFLLGMILMTDGLKAVAGDAMRRVLARFAGGPVTALISGATVTALVQSSHATTLATIGFVSAGLLTFSQAIGVILGANLGTTSTGWLVSLLGLKLSMGKIAMPLIGIGALAKLMGRGKLAHAGVALAGFGVIFVGIDALQAGMAELSSSFDSTSLPDDSLLGRMLLVLIGVAMTIVMQSSSAAVATTLAALHSKTINLDQAAAMVIGQNVGTTLTAALAAIGATVPAKRTALAHILFNVVTGMVAFSVLPVFSHSVDAATEAFGGSDDAVSLAAFHTTFNLLGVALFLPFTSRFARLIERIIPERKGKLARNLDNTVADLPGIAVEAARRALMEIAAHVIQATRRQIADSRYEPELEAVEEAMTRTRQFLSRVGRLEATTNDYPRHVSNLHAVDHIDRLVSALKEPTPRRVSASSDRLESFRKLADDATASALWLGDASLPASADGAKAASTALAELRRVERPRLLESTAQGKYGSEQALVLLEGMHWLDRVAYHIWRICHHLAAQEPAGSQTAPAHEVLDVEEIRHASASAA